MLVAMGLRQRCLFYRCLSCWRCLRRKDPSVDQKVSAELTERPQVAQPVPEAVASLAWVGRVAAPAVELVQASGRVALLTA